jgi:hypothetical protein
MAQPSDNLRDRLLAALPQPENLTAYREETACALAKHHRALRWDKILANTIILSACAVTVVFIFNPGFWHLGMSALHSVELGTAFLYGVGLFLQVQYKIYESEIANLKEIKQVQLQILELQASLQKEP